MALETLALIILTALDPQRMHALALGCFLVFLLLTLLPFFGNDSRQNATKTLGRRLRFLPKALVLLLASSATILFALHLPSLAPTAGGAILVLPTIFPVITLALGVALIFLEIHSALSDDASSRLLPQKVAQMGQLRFLAITHLAIAFLLFIEAYLGQVIHLWLVLALSIIAIALLLEVVVRLLSRLYLPRSHWHQLPPPGALTIMKFWGRPYSLAFPAPHEQSNDFSIRLPEMWMWPTVRRALLPLIITVAGILWLSTSVHEVPSGHRGLHHHLGSVRESALEPGLHFSLPFPFGKVDAVATATIREVVLGFESDPGDAILWEKAHYLNEEHSLIGGGDDFLAISVPIAYRIADPLAHFRQTTETDSLVKGLARRALLQETLKLSAFEIMTTRREELRAAIHQRLQEQLDARQSGISILLVSLRDIHPPVQVAGSYQEVLAAMEDKQSHIYSAEALVQESLPRARAEAYTQRVNAESDKDTRILRANGEAERFRLVASIFRKNPEAFRLRERSQAVDETLAGAKKLVMGSSFQSDLPAYVDLRQVLNPAFIDNALPEDQSLIPSLDGSQTLFDQEINGYLLRGRGSAPAADFLPNDQDDLLENSSPEPNSP